MRRPGDLNMAPDLRHYGLGRRWPHILISGLRRRRDPCATRARRKKRRWRECNWCTRGWRTAVSINQSRCNREIVSAGRAQQFYDIFSVDTDYIQHLSPVSTLFRWQLRLWLDVLQAFRFRYLYSTQNVLYIGSKGDINHPQAWQKLSQRVFSQQHRVCHRHCCRNRQHDSQLTGVKTSVTSRLSSCL